MTWIVFDEPDYIFGSGIRPGVIQRTFITLDPAQQGHYLIQNPIVETGDFEHPFEISTTETVGFNRILAPSDDSGNSYQVILNAGAGKIFIEADNGTSTIFPESNIIVNDGKLHIVIPKRVGNNFSVDIDGIPGATTSLAGVDVDVAFIGIRPVLTNPFNGIIANPDLGNGNAWKLNNPTGNAEQAANGNNLITYVNIPTGAPDRELFTLNTSTDPDQWENADKSRIIQVA